MLGAYFPFESAEKPRGAIYGWLNSIRNVNKTQMLFGYLLQKAIFSGKPR